MRLSVRHTTRYAFASPVAHGLQRLRLRPKPTGGQTVLDWAMTLEGAALQAEYEDHHRNATALVSITPGARELVIACDGVVETADNAGVVGPHAGHVPLWCFLRRTRLTTPGPALRALAARFKHEPADRLGALHRLSDAVADAVAYRPGETEVATTAEQALAAGKGVCQDHAHVMIAAGRLLDIPTRYVSGYLKLDGDGEGEGEPSAERQAGHGWVEAHVDGLGWVGFDVANRVCPDARYVRVATGCDYAEAAPVTGLASGAGATTLAVAVAVVAPEQMQAQQQQQAAAPPEPRP